MPNTSLANAGTYGEFAFTHRDFQRVAAMLYEDSGIALTQSRNALVYSRLSKRIRSLGLTDFDSYCDLVETPGGAAERRKMLSALTTNLTGFYREPHHFEHLRTQILPGLVQRAKAGERVRIWSSACSTGAEAYTLGLTLLSVMPDAARYDVRILATDIDPDVLARARAGLWPQADLEKIPPNLRDKWFRPLSDDGAQWQASPDLARMITFRELNLIGSWPMRGQFQVIFCRNVAIYFDDATQARLWSRFADQLDDGGHLYIGHSERIQGSAVRSFESVGVTIYRKISGKHRA